MVKNLSREVSAHFPWMCCWGLDGKGKGWLASLAALGACDDDAYNVQSALTWPLNIDPSIPPHTPHTSTARQAICQGRGPGLQARAAQPDQPHEPRQDRGTCMRSFIVTARGSRGGAAAAAADDVGAAKQS